MKDLIGVKWLSIGLIIFILLANNIYAQNKNIYDEGYKNLKWNMTQEQVKSIVDESFTFKKLGFGDSFNITDADTYTCLTCTKKEEALSYQYHFSFFNNSLYKIVLEISADDKNWQVVKELSESFLKDIVDSYGKSKKGVIFEDQDIYNSIYDSYWNNNKISIYKNYIEKHGMFNYVQNEFRMALLNNQLVKNLNIAVRQYEIRKKLLEKSDASEKAKSLRKRF